MSLPRNNIAGTTPGSSMYMVKEQRITYALSPYVEVAGRCAGRILLAGQPSPWYVRPDGTGFDGQPLLTRRFYSPHDPDHSFVFDSDITADRFLSMLCAVIHTARDPDHVPNLPAHLTRLADLLARLEVVTYALALPAPMAAAEPRPAQRDSGIGSVVGHDSVRRVMGLVSAPDVSDLPNPNEALLATFSTTSADAVAAAARAINDYTRAQIGNPARPWRLGPFEATLGEPTPPADNVG